MALLPENRYEKLRYPVAVILSTVIILVWYLFFSPPPRLSEPTSDTPTTPVEEGLSVENETTPSSDVILDTETLKEAPAVPAPAEDIASPEINSEEAKAPTHVPPAHVQLQNEYLTVTLSTVDAAIVKAMVVNRTNQILEFNYSEDFEIGGLPGFETGKLFFSAELPTLDQPAPVIRYKLVSADVQEAVFTAQLKSSSGLISVIKTYTIGTDFSLQLTVTFVDENGKNVRAPYYILNGSNIGKKEVVKGAFELKQLSYEVGDENETILGASFFGSSKTSAVQEGSVDWIALDNRFYARILMAEDLSILDKSEFRQRDYTNADGSENSYMAGALKISGKGKDSFQFFYLPKNRAVLNDYYETDKHYFFNLFHQFSFMRILSSLMYWLLEQINLLFKSYGWSILVMTLIIKLLTFPLTHKGMKSMYKMQGLNPKIEAIKSQYKGNSQKMNAEMMLLYKKESVSPLGGCLPMLVPIPIFIALYSLFQNMVELRNVPFFWIGDLSLPDTIYTLSFSIPFLGNSINLLPIVMTATALIQTLLPMGPQRSKPKAPSSGPPSMSESMQKQMNIMKYFFPIMFFFICWNLPSALVFFWTVQNVFSLFQTFYIRKVLNFSRR